MTRQQHVFHNLCHNFRFLDPRPPAPDHRPPLPLFLFVALYAIYALQRFQVDNYWVHGSAGFLNSLNDSFYNTSKAADYALLRFFLCPSLIKYYIILYFVRIRYISEKPQIHCPDYSNFVG